MANIKGAYVAVAAIGGILLWSGLFNKAVTTTIQDIVKGQKPAKGPLDTSTPVTGSTGTTGSSGPAPGPVASGKPSANRALGKAMAASRGWVGAQWDALDWIWTEDSGWDNTAANPSGAYGIPQALPGSKMGPAANPPTSSAIAQIRWGLGYIADRYGTPEKAKAFHLVHGWY